MEGQETEQSPMTVSNQRTDHGQHPEKVTSAWKPDGQLVERKGPKHNVTAARKAQQNTEQQEPTNSEEREP